MLRIESAGAVVAGLALVACRGTGDRHAVDSGPEPLTAPLDAAGEFDSTVGFLLARHDGDGDGQITASEYDRGATSFGRLDRNEDGVISADDWRPAAPDGRVGDSAAERRRNQGATAVLATYFQVDEPGVVRADELAQAHAIYDTDQDGLLDAQEFLCAFEVRAVDAPGVRLRLGRRTPWEALLAGTDVDGDGRVAAAELDEFFALADGDGDERWTFTARQSARPKEPVERERPPAPAEGTRAPDFTLAPPEGGDPVTLSSFAGHRPVALIFGSYT